MMDYNVTRDAQGIITCKVRGFLSEADAAALVNEIIYEVKVTRRSGTPLRLLFDNREGSVFSTKAAAALDELKSHHDPRDRAAALLPDAVTRLQANRMASEGTQVFTSEEEAMNWLCSEG